MSSDIISVSYVSIIITIANLLILMLILKFFLFKPVDNILEERKKYIEDQKEKADKDRADAAKLKADYQTRLNGAEDCGKAMISEAEKSSSELYERVVNEANARAEEIIADARRKSELEKKNHMEETEQELAGIVSAAAAKIAATQGGMILDSYLYDKFLDKVGDDK